MANLKILRLDENQLSGAIPSWLGSFNGTQLGLANNVFSGTVPDSMLQYPFNSVDWGCSDPNVWQNPPATCSYFNPTGNFWVKTIEPTVVNVPGAFLIACPSGTYRSGADSTVAGTAYYPAPICTSCALGTIAAQAGATFCTACPANTYAHGDGISCDPCPTNAISAVSSPNISSCTCTFGYAQTSLAGGNFTCAQCSAGTFFNIGSAQCQPCSVGSYSAAAAYSCTTCPSGYYSISNNTDCAACPAGTYLNSTANACASCPAGTVSQTAAALACTSCPSGSQANVNATACAPCPAGTYLAGNGSCLLCAAGQYSPSASATSCLANPIGAYSTTDRTSYVLCTAGSYLNTVIQNCSVCALGTFSASNGSATCTTNTPGYYSSADRKSQIACPAGTFLNGTSLMCSTCAPGTFTNLPGQTTCQANPTGQVSTPQTTLSSSLQLGGVSAASFGAAQNATLTAAIASSLNVSASNVAITAVADAASGRRHLASGGQVTANFTVTCVGAATASAATTMLNTTASFSSALARTLSASTDPVLSAVSAASISVSAPQASTLYLASQPCPAGTFLNGATQSCDACAIGTVAPGEGTTTCTVCPARTVWLNASVSCAPCPNGAVTSPNNAAQCACGPGFYDTLFGASLDSPVCAPCPLGGVCRSGFIAADEGWWRESTVSAVLYKCRESNCLAEDVVGPLTPGGAAAGNATALLPPPLALNSSTEPTNCVPGNTGPLCSLCVSGYAIQSGQCLPCNPGSAYALWSPGEKAGLILPIIVFSLLAIMFAFFQPLSPRLERTASRISDTTVAASEKAKAKVVGAVTSCFIRHRNAESAQPSAGEKIEEREARAASAGKEAPAAELEKNVEMQGAPASLERRTARLPRASTFNSHRLGNDGEDDEAEGHAAGFVEEAPAEEGAEESPDAGTRRPLASSSKGGREFAESASLARSTLRLARKSVAAAAELVGEDMSESDSDDEDYVFGETGAMLDMYYTAQRLLDKAQKYGKILINFYQIVSTFLRSLDVPWPHIFVSVMGKVNIINLNLVHLPKAACMSPNTTYYEEFLGYTLGLLFALLFAPSSGPWACTCSRPCHCAA